MANNEPNYFGLKLGEAIASGAVPIANALQRKYALQRQKEEEERERQMMQDRQNQIMQLTMAKEGVAYDPMNPAASFEQYAKSSAQDINLGREKTRAQIAAIQRQEMTMPQAAVPQATTPAQVAVDRSFAKDYADYVAGGGYSDVQKQIQSLEEIADMLEGGEKMTGPIVGRLPDIFRQSVAPKSIPAQQQVEQSIQKTLRQTLGAQFTEKEGERFLARGYDPRLSPEQNAKKLRDAISQLKQMADAKQKAAEYYEANGTLAGFRGGVAPTPAAPIAPATTGWTPEKQSRLEELRAKMGR